MKRSILAVVFVLLLGYSVYATWQVCHLKGDIAAQAKELQDAKTKLAARPAPHSSQPNLMNDPVARQAMIDRQRQSALDRASKMATSMGLTPEQTQTFVKALTDQFERNVQRQEAVMKGDPSKRSELIKVMSEEAKADEAKFREALGEPLFAKIKDFQTGQMITVQATQLRTQFAGTPTPLQDAQANQLAKIVFEETSKIEAVKPTAPPPNTDPAQRMQMMISQHEEINRHVLDRAKSILKPDQLATLKQQQKAEIDRYKSRMSPPPLARPPGMTAPMVPAAGTNRPAPPHPPASTS